VGEWHIGFKFGEFAKTRTRAIFRAKTLVKKKQKRGGSPTASLLNEQRINKLKLVKSGKVRKQRLVTGLGGDLRAGFIF
jgi:hypothetical protein